MKSAVITALNTMDPRLSALDDGALRLTYGDVRRCVAQEERWLRSCGVARCALMADNGAHWVISDLALLAGGALNVPVPGFFTREQVVHVLDDAGVDSILTDDPQAVLRSHPQFASAGLSNRTGLTLLRREVAAAPPIASDVVKVTYTSGSTGTPKGVCLTRESIEAVTRSLVGATRSVALGSHLCVLPLPTLLENIAGVYAPLLLGLQIRLRPLASLGMSYGALDPARIVAAIAALRPDSIVLVPELLRVLLGAAQRNPELLRSLRFVAVGGASVSLELLNQARDCGLPVFQGYGLSECASVVCLNTPEHNRLGSVGRVLPHARVRIDASGEICVRGATMRGYLGSAPVAAEIRTGDLGEIDADGFVYVRGRAKNMFITSMGRNVTPEWVERELTCEPTIAHAMVSGEARPYPVALIAAASSAVTTQDIDRAVLRANARLPDYARVRDWAPFPESPSLANGLLTSNGRLRRADIVARHGELLASLYLPEAQAI